MNEDRSRFLSAFGLGFCNRGNHTTTNAYEYPVGEGYTWCLEHPCPTGEPDPPQRGSCKVGRIHKADAIYWVPVMGVHVCRRHLATIVSEVLRRGYWGPHVS